MYYEPGEERVLQEYSV